MNFVKDRSKLLLLSFPLIVFVAVLSWRGVDFAAIGMGDTETRWPSQRELYRKLRDVRKVLLIYGTGNSETAAAYRKRAEFYANSSRWLEVIVKPDTAVTSAELKSMPLSLVGSPSSNRILRRMLPDLPIAFEGRNVRVENLMSLQPQDVYYLSMYPNPLEPALPISVTTGHDDEAILDALAEPVRHFYSAGDFWIARHQQKIVLGFFEQENGSPWTISRSRTRNYLEARHVVAETRHFRFIYHGQEPQPDEIEQFIREEESRTQNLLAELKRADLNLPELPRLDYHLYASAEDKGLITRNTDLSHHDPRTRSVHALFTPEVKGDDFYAAARLLTTLLVGESNSLALRAGLAMYFTQDWGKHGYGPWAKLFRESGDLSPLQELLDDDIYARESYLFVRPMAGSFVAYLMQELGWREFVQLYQNWPDSGLPDIFRRKQARQEYERGWLAFLDALEKKPVGRKKRAHQPVFQKGFCFAHEGYQIYNGYLSRKSFQSLQKLQNLGNDWISVTPFGYLGNPNEPEFFRFSFGAGSENDESLIVAAQYARQLGMRVMLKPHVLMSGPHWGWPGDVKMQSEEDWQAFFKYYYKWIRHYAVLAEIYDFDIFCIGVELLHTTREHQKEWREIIRRIRNLYSGPLTYASNWWQEFEQVEFWDELDYIGLNLYYPLSEKDTVSVDELVAGMNTGMPVVELVVQKFEKPLLLTEVGFTSTRQPWKRPHERVRGAEVYFEHQAKCYEAVFRSFWERPWFYGFYWWKWPTYLEDGGARHSGFTPNGKLAEGVVDKWYSKPTPSRMSGVSAQ